MLIENEKVTSWVIDKSFSGTRLVLGFFPLIIMVYNYLAFSLSVILLEGGSV